MDALAAGISGCVGLLTAPGLFVLMQRTPIHLRLRAVGAHCSNCGSAVRGLQRYSLLATVTGTAACSTCNRKLYRGSPYVEIGAALLLALCGGQLGLAWALPAYWVFFLAAFAISIIDLRIYIIPTRIVYPAFLLATALFAVAAAIDGSWPSLLRALACALGVWFFYFLLILFYGKGIGMGDVRLALLIGLATGWLGVGNTVFAVFLSFIIGAVGGIAVAVLRFQSMRFAALKSYVPFGPFMVVGASLTVLFGGVLAHLVGA